MTDPTSATTIPHLLGINLDGTGIATTIVVAKNRTTNERQAKATDSNKLVIFDAADFTSGYSADDVIEFENCGASLGGTTITIIDTIGGFQSAEIACTSAPTGAINL